MSSKNTFFYGTGRRKTSSARVFVRNGTGTFKIRKSLKKSKSKESQSKESKLWELEKYFAKSEQVHSALAPLKALNLNKSFDVLATVKGGGFTGQAEALRHGLARALLQVSAEYRSALKQKGYLTRDSRMVERKKYGHHKARKSTQFSKR